MSEASSSLIASNGSATTSGTSALWSSTRLSALARSSSDERSSSVSASSSASDGSSSAGAAPISASSSMDESSSHPSKSPIFASGSPPESSSVSISGSGRASSGAKPVPNSRSSTIAGGRIAGSWVVWLSSTSCSSNPSGVRLSSSSSISTAARTAVSETREMTPATSTGFGVSVSKTAIGSPTGVSCSTLFSPPPMGVPSGDSTEELASGTSLQRSAERRT